MFVYWIYVFGSSKTLMGDGRLNSGCPVKDSVQAIRQVFLSHPVGVRTVICDCPYTNTLKKPPAILFDGQHSFSRPMKGSCSPVKRKMIFGTYYCGALLVWAPLSLVIEIILSGFRQILILCLSTFYADVGLTYRRLYVKLKL